MIGMTGTPGQIVIFVGVITALQALINHLGIKLTALLTDWSGYLILGTTALLVVACFAFAPTHDFSRLWTFTNFSGDPGGGVWPPEQLAGLSIRSRSLAADLHDHRLRRLGAHLRGDLQGRAFGAAGHYSCGRVVVARRLGHALGDGDRHPGHG